MLDKINFIDLQTAKTFLFDGKTFVQSEIDKKSNIVARVLYFDITTYSFQAKKDLLESELLAEIELKMYEEAGLDPEKEYKIVYIPKETAVNDSLLIEVFMIEKEAIKEKYKNAISKVKHIDYLVIPPLSFQALYHNKGLTKKHDLFIYIAQNEAFVAFYKDGVYLSSKKIDSLNEILDYLSERGFSLSIKELETILIEKGLDKSKYLAKEYALFDHIVKIFTKLFIKIDNLAIHNRSIFNYTHIERVFFGINSKQVPNLQLVTQSFTKNAEFYSLSFSIEKNHDVLDIICALYAYNSINFKDDSKNLTIFKRQLPFYKREFGKLLLSTAVAFIFLSIYPIYNQYKIEKLQSNLFLLQEQYQQNLKSVKLLKKRSTKLQKQLNNLIAQKESIDNQLNQIEDIIDTLIRLKSYNKKHISTLLTINQLLKKHSLNIDKIMQVDENKISIELYSDNKQRELIANFMSDLLNRGFAKVSSGKIELDEFGYKSTIEIQR